MRSSSVPTITLVLFILCVPLVAEVIHVPADQPTIQAGIDAAADGDTVLVADGTYTGEGNRDISFDGKAITVRSEYGPENCVVDCEWIAGHRGFHFHCGENRASVLEGFTIRGGYVPHSGAGILCEGSSPEIRGNIITKNTIEMAEFGDGGGGIACLGASPLISGNVISGNTVDGPCGGGIFCEEGSAPEITGNSIEGNAVDDWYYGGSGGGLYANAASGTVVITDNTFRANIAINFGSGLCVSGCEVEISGNLIEDHTGDSCSSVFLGTSGGTFSGNTISGNRGSFAGGIYCYETAPVLTGNTITGNDGCGIYCDASSPDISFNILSENSIAGLICYYGSSPEIQNNTVSNTTGPGIRISGSGAWPTFRDNSITGNTGGGILCTDGGHATLLNDTIQGNTIAGTGAGIRIESGGFAEIDSCRVVGNESTDKGAGIYVGGESSCLVTNTLVSGNQSGDFGGGLSVTYDSGLQLDNCTVTDNTAVLGGGLFSWGTTGVSNSIIWGNQDEDLRGDSFIIDHSDIGGGWPGEGNFDADPLFAGGPEGDYYLSQVAAGQSEDSPCVDAGQYLAAEDCWQTTEGPACLGDLSTRTDEFNDLGIADIGFHYPASPLVAARLTCLPNSGTVPFTTRLALGIDNRLAGEFRQATGRIDVALGNGVSYPNWRAGSLVLEPGESFSQAWMQGIPAAPAVIGGNTFSLTVADVTPPPYNQPPYSPSGSLDRVSCTVSAAAQ